MTISSSTKKCPFCAEEILVEAIKCKHCGELLNKNATQSQASNQEKVSCPICHSTEVTAQKKGFGIGKALVGGAFAGGVGLAAGLFGRKNIELTCLRCGHRFKPGTKKRVWKSILQCACGNSTFSLTSEKGQSTLRCMRCENLYAYPSWDVEVSSGKKGTVLVNLSPIGSTPSELMLISKGDTRHDQR